MRVTGFETIGEGLPVAAAWPSSPSDAAEVPLWATMTGLCDPPEVSLGFAAVLWF